MIGHFAFRQEGLPDHVIVEMLWASTGEAARVHASDDVVKALVELDIAVRPRDELMQLPFALSYAVLLSTLSGAPLHLAGDRTVLPTDWGTLFEANDHTSAELRSQTAARQSRPYGLD